MTECNLLFFEVSQGFNDNNIWFLFLFLIVETVEYLVTFDNIVHFPLKVKILVASDGLIVLSTNAIQLNKLHNDFG